MIPAPVAIVTEVDLRGALPAEQRSRLLVQVDRLRPEASAIVRFAGSPLALVEAIDRDRPGMFEWTLDAETLYVRRVTHAHHRAPSFA